MADQFDPENVERFQYGPFEEEWFTDQKDFVLASDYDKLLALYRGKVAAEGVLGHLMKRMYDECGFNSADEFIRLVESGAYDVPSPWSKGV